ncbi:hypothetical protein B0O80DRAFT_427616 [Mortierella sp. GBAus27b]|nr:hypothetical protein B0O80DRAFT_427616 [Mortierella sp. GBAus27b]
MAFPKLKEFGIYSLDFGSTLDNLSRCPSLESVKSWGSWTKFLMGMKDGVFPGIKKLGLRARAEQKQALVKMLESRTGIQELDFTTREGSDCLFNAINHQASTLTRLSLELTEFCMDTISKVLGCCGRLTDVSLGFIEREHMVRVLGKTHWKNPKMLRRLDLSSCKQDEELLTDRHTLELAQNDRLKRPTLFNSWTNPTGEPILPYDEQLLNTLFMAAQGSTRLGTITIDYVTYTKAFH